MDIEVEMADGGMLPLVPLLNVIYTVTDFVDNTGMVMPINCIEDLNPAILLAEIPGYRSRVTKRPIGWPIVFFHPVDERETDIGALRGLLTPTYEDLQGEIRHSHRDLVREVEDA